ncbi:hypothetical protein Taro_003785 [Colocasia esculenta]|uniref:Uncharacterized protein n=1 Tax=Colocasia esculenta TaxID=4460 RepID=A0A843TSV0_COLES|nr:hypothetical protein [Colocasia esculenta]
MSHLGSDRWRWRRPRRTMAMTLAYGGNDLNSLTCGGLRLGMFVHLSFDFVLLGVPACLPGRNDEANDGNADLIASDEYTPLLGNSFLPYGMEYESSSRAGVDLTSEVDFIEPSSHYPLPAAVATGCDDSTSAYAEYKNNILLHLSMLIFPGPVEECPAAEAASSGGQPFCDQLLSWGVMGSNFIAATSSPFFSWDGLGSPFFTSQAYSAFQVGDTADGDGLFGQTSHNLEPSIPTIDGGGLDLSAIDYPPAFQEIYAEESSSVQPPAPEAETEVGNLPYNFVNFIVTHWGMYFYLSGNPPPLDFDDGGSPPLGLEVLPEHGVDWPTRARPSSGPEDEDLWNFLVDRVRAVVDSDDPPPIDAVKRVLKEKTTLAFNSGISQNRWMAFHVVEENNPE